MPLKENESIDVTNFNDVKVIDIITNEMICLGKISPSQSCNTIVESENTTTNFICLENDIYFEYAERAEHFVNTVKQVFSDLPIDFECKTKNERDVSICLNFSTMFSSLSDLVINIQNAVFAVKTLTNVIKQSQYAEKTLRKYRHYAQHSKKTRVRKKYQWALAGVNLVKIEASN